MYTLELLVNPGTQTVLELTWWVLALGGALLVFANIQAYYANPQRRQLEREWARAFDAAQQERYADRRIEWRAKDLSLHFGHQLTGQSTLDEWFDSQMSITSR